MARRCPSLFFLGTFDGQNHRITGLALTGSASIYGFFSQIASGAVVRDLTVEGKVTPAGTQSRVGGIAGENYGSTPAAASPVQLPALKPLACWRAITAAADLSRTAPPMVWYTPPPLLAALPDRITAASAAAPAPPPSIPPSANSEFSTADLESSVYDLLKQQQTTETGVNTDAGGIAGYSTGVIDSCTNEGSVGYPHVGYNVAASWAVRTALSQTVSTGASSRAARTWAALGQMIPDITIQAGS